MKSIPRALHAVLVLGPWLAAGCFTVDPVNVGTGGAAGTGGALGTGGASTLCEHKCTTLKSCGVINTSTCAADCEAGSASYHSCLSVAGSDCNSIAMCEWQNDAPVVCPGGGGVPSGDRTCLESFNCTGGCVDQPESQSCVCDCVALAKKAVAIDLLVAASCATAKCNSQCSPGGSDCISCVAANCAGLDAKCKMN